MATYMQVICTVITCWQCLIMGMITAWPSSTLRLFESSKTPLQRAMSETELALFGSMPSVGALLGTPLLGALMDTLGRRYCCILIGLTAVISWSVIAVSNSVEIVLTAMFIAGLCGGVFLVVPIYICEFSQENVRGALTTGMTIFNTLGMLISYVLGGFLEYHTMVYVCLTMCVFGTVFCYFLKESPVYLMVKGLEDDAAKSIAFYRSVSSTSKEVQEELEVIRRTLFPEMDTHDSPEAEQLKPPSDSCRKLTLWEFISRSRSTRQAIILSLFLVTASVFHGLVVVQVYAEPLFAEAIPHMSSTLCSILLAVFTVLAGLVAAYLTEKAGRRLLMILSSLLSAICCLVLGAQIQLHWGPNWVTPVCIYLFCIVYTLGASNVPYVFLAEVFLPEIKSFASSLAMEWAWLCNFAILFIFNPLLKAIGLGPIFYMFAVVCLLTVVFSWLFMPETKGIPVDEIQVVLTK
ncbi:hypothetical protein K1T71_013160 [Dendrolimus kikuchii]|uniref:Uncharacterized protein n=1 Tax=Dendrolimus kikuchii TaxID=765133 RepID=A0ACC1CJA4_9NEOP|nr:hypothetical protein K1T71_013160 [Dendrolimus kikuchii]